jgi:tRNA(Ile)-lysidine synthase
MALLLLAAAARPGTVEAATVDHRLRSASGAEAEFVADICRKLEVPHAILMAQWDRKPETALQERARTERYRLLALWGNERGISQVLTAHHADDQAETLLMRLNRGSGVRGLAGMRAVRTIDQDVRLVRPLLSWRRSELERICKNAGIQPIHDPSNQNESFERVRVRKGLADGAWLDPAAIARSAAYLGDADAAIGWATDAEWERGVHEGSDAIVYRPARAPTEILRRIVASAVIRLASEGEAELRGKEIDGLLDALTAGSRATLRGVLCSGGAEWRFTRAPKRRA